MARVTLLLGGNIGDVNASLDRAISMIDSEVGAIMQSSERHTSEAWGFTQATPPFVNVAVEVETELEPLDVLSRTQSIEVAVGRDRAVEGVEKEARGERYASRVVDIDIIFYDDIEMRSDALTIPHPLYRERDFVMQCLADIK